MKNLKLIVVSSLMFLALFSSNILSAQTSEVESSSFSVSTDIVSSFIWRGLIASPTINFQPAVTYTNNNFTIGSWGSGDAFGTYKEIDLYLTYATKGFSATLIDYYWNTSTRYFNFKNNSTGHNVEIGVSYENENFPLNISVGTMIYGEDKKYLYDASETDSLVNNYSTYFQLSYTFDINGTGFNVFAGATPFSGLYGNNFAVIYSGFTASKEIKITESFSLPMFATFSTNPQTEDYFAVLGFSF